MNQHEYEGSQAMILQLAKVIDGPTLRLDNFIIAIGKAEAIGPIADPTLYKKGSHNMEQIKRIAQAFRRCRNDIKEPLQKLTGSGVEAP